MKNYIQLWEKCPKLEELTLEIFKDISRTKNYCYDNGIAFDNGCTIDYDISSLDAEVKEKIVPCLKSCFTVIDECKGWQAHLVEDHIKVVPRH